MTATRYTAAKRLEVEAERQAQLAARRAELAAGTFEEFLGYKGCALSAADLEAFDPEIASAWRDEFAALLAPVSIHSTP